LVKIDQEIWKGDVSLMPDNDKKLKEFYDKAFKLACEEEPQMVAGVFMAQALRLYKSFLDNEEYNNMVDTISESRDKIQPFLDLKKETLH
tara:strand:+ start:1385 stop:1654 length:270 start_codon:yes stop_codon:yes gene_type:complete